MPHNDINNIINKLLNYFFVLCLNVDTSVCKTYVVKFVVAHMFVYLLFDRVLYHYLYQQAFFYSSLKAVVMNNLLVVLIQPSS